MDLQRRQQPALDGHFFGWNHLQDRGRASGRTLEVAGSSTANGALVDIWDSNNNANQKWNITPTDSGYYSVINVNSGKAMEVLGGWARPSLVPPWISGAEHSSTNNGRSRLRKR